MKRFLSLFCALSIILSISAAPAKLASRFEQPVKFEKKAQLQKKSAKKQVKFAGKQFQKANELNVAEAKQLAKVRAIKKAPKAATEVTVSAIGHSYDASTLDVFYMLYNEDQSLAYSFDIILPEGEEDVELGKTYTLEDMDPEWSTWGTPLYVSYGYGTAYAEATFTKTQDAEGFVQIAATIVDEEGAEFTLTYDEASLPQAPEGGEFEADEISVYHGDTLVQYVLTDSVDRLEFYFAFKIEEGAGDIESGKTYTFDDAIARYTGAVFNGVENINFASLSFTKTVAADLSYEIAAEATDENGNVWKVTAAKGAPKVSEETLTLNGTAEVGTYASYIEAADADTTVYVALIVYTDDLAGEWTEEDLSGYSYVRFNEARYVINAANFTVTFDETANQYKVAGKLETENEDDDLDQIIFTLDLTLAGPEPVVFPEELTGDDFELELYGTSQWELSGSSDEDVYLAILGTTKQGSVAGTYGPTDLDDYYTYVTLDGSTYYDMTDANLVVTFENNVITVTGTLEVTNEEDAADVKELTINVSGKYTVPTERHYTYDAEEAFEQNFETYTVATDYLAKYSALLVKAENAEDSTTIALLLYIPEGETELVAGEYTVSNTGAPFTVNAGTGLSSQGGVTYSFAAFRDAEGYIDVPLWWLVEGKVVVADNGDITVDALNSNAQAIKSTITKEAQGIENIVLTEKVQKVVVDGAVYVIRDNKMFNVLGTQVR